MPDFLAVSDVYHGDNDCTNCDKPSALLNTCFENASTVNV